MGIEEVKRSGLDCSWTMSVQKEVEVDVAWLRQGGTWKVDRSGSRYGFVEGWSGHELNWEVVEEVVPVAKGRDGGPARHSSGRVGGP